MKIKDIERLDTLGGRMGELDSFSAQTSVFERCYEDLVDLYHRSPYGSAIEEVLDRERCQLESAITSLYDDSHLSLFGDSSQIAVNALQESLLEKARVVTDVRHHIETHLADLLGVSSVYQQMNLAHLTSHEATETLSSKYSEIESAIAEFNEIAIPDQWGLLIGRDEPFYTEYIIGLSSVIASYDELASSPKEQCERLVEPAGDHVVEEINLYRGEEYQRSIPLHEEPAPFTQVALHELGKEGAQIIKSLLREIEDPGPDATRIVAHQLFEIVRRMLDHYAPRQEVKKWLQQIGSSVPESGPSRLQRLQFLTGDSNSQAASSFLNIDTRNLLRHVDYLSKLRHGKGLVANVVSLNRLAAYTQGWVLVIRTAAEVSKRVEPR